MAITSNPQKAGFPLTLELSDFILPKKSWLKVSQIRTLSTVRLGKRITRLAEKELELAIEGLNGIIGS